MAGARLCSCSLRGGALTAGAVFSGEAERPGSARSSPERTPRLEAPLRQDSGTSSTETLTADPPTPVTAPAPAPAAAPSSVPAAAEAGRKPAPPAPVTGQTETEARVETGVTETPAPVETVNHSGTGVQNVDQSQRMQRFGLDAADDIGEIPKPEPEGGPTARMTAEEQPVSSEVTEPPAPVPASLASSATSAAQSQTETSIELPPVENPADMTVDAQTRERHQTPSPETTVEESLPKESAPAAPEASASVDKPGSVVPKEPAVPESSASTVTETSSPVVLKPPVTGTSAPVVLKPPAAILETPGSVTPEPPSGAAVLSETLPTAPSHKDAAEPPEPHEEEDLETVRLQREVDSALARLDTNLEEALAETAAFTESSSLQTQSRTAPETETETEETTQETLPVVVKETPKVVQETPKVVQDTPKVEEVLLKTFDAPKVVEEVPKVVQEMPKVVSPLREVVEERREVIETLLPVSRVPAGTPHKPPTRAEVPRARSQDEATAVVTESQPSSEETSLPVRSSVGAGLEQRRGRRAPKLGPASRQQPVEVTEEVVAERAEKVQRNRVSTQECCRGLCRVRLFWVLSVRWMLE